MQPLMLRIPGEFWDTQIYQGRLYLFHRTSEIVTIDWDRLIQTWSIEDELTLGMYCAFLESDYLYGSRFKRVLGDVEIKRVIEAKFRRLGEMSFDVTPSKLKECRIDTQDNPFPFPHADCLIYDKKMFACGNEGVFKATCNKKTTKPVSTKAHHLWDARSVHLSASYGSLAVAAGDDGLFELPIYTTGLYEQSEDPQQRISSNCTRCDWLFYSLYGSSHTSGGVLADFNKSADGSTRELAQLIGEKTLFGRKSGYSWGTSDKICNAFRGEVQIVRYEPWHKDSADRIRNLDTISLYAWKGDVVAGGLAPFGVVIECENALVVVPSIGPTITIPGEPVAWRVFPRARHYRNQLHVVRDDCVEIYSFNHDYFASQDDKSIGLRVFDPDQRAPARAR